MENEVVAIQEGIDPLENERHELFCIEAASRNNATRSYMQVYPDASYRSARAASIRLLGDEGVSKRVAFLKTQAAENLKFDKSRVLLEISKLAFSDIRDLFRPDGSLIPPHELDADIAAAVVSMEYEELTAGEGESKRVIGRRIKLKLADKTRNLELLGKHLKLFVDKVEVVHKYSLEDILSGEIGEIQEQAKTD